MMFAFLDAWNIGANDVANSFASSVSSRSLEYWQAMILAALAEFLGATLAGSRVADTIRNQILDVSFFDDDPAVLMLTMACALVGSSLWLTLATRVGMPVSTTHSIVGAIIGAGLGAGADIHWGWDGFAQIVASWFIAPAIAGGFASIAFLTSKYLVLERKHDVRNALLYAPVLVFICFSILTMLIVWKGAPKLGLDDLPTGTIIGSIFGVGGVASVVYMLFFYPVFKRRIVYDDWTLKPWAVLIGPYYFFKPVSDIPPLPEGVEVVIDYYAGRRGDDNNADVPADHVVDVENSSDDQVNTKSQEENIKEVHEIDTVSEVHESKLEEKMSTRQLWWSLLKQGPKMWPRLLWLVVIHGFDQDVINHQANSGDSILGKNIKNVHSQSKFYNNKVEFVYSILQAITATTMSFAHGSNDIANAAGPLSAIYLVWSTGTSGESSEVPIWVLCYTAAALVIGVWTYGYNIMRNLGNKLILQSPSRGFSIEIGAAVTTVIASQLAIPVSTTQSAVGATVFVGLCNKNLKAVNWRMVLFCYLGWIVTLPCAGLVAGLLMLIIINAPRFDVTYALSS